MRDQDLEAFRREVREFLDTAPTPAIREAGRKVTSVFTPFEETIAWQKILHQRGWAAPGWPREYGGTGWTPEQRMIFDEEYFRRDLPALLPNGLLMVGPMLMELGTQEQKGRYLPRILSGEDYWTQGYSEPAAGSDLASLGCMAVADGDDYIINGSKIWTTLAHKANRMFMLVRTSREGKKQQGITFLLLDRMDYPGMEIRPIIGLDGFPEQCEVFFTDVRVPQSGRVGAENEGWFVAKALLKHERGGAALSPGYFRRLHLLRQAAAITPAPLGGTYAQDGAFLRDLGQLEADIAAYAAFEKMVHADQPIASDAAMPSMNKVFYSELAQKIAQLGIRLAGGEALPLQIEALTVGSGVESLGTDHDLVAMPSYLNSRAASIYAGTNEVQRDLIARSLARV